MSSEIKFIADCMLGKLCRWLRICGFDTFYSRQIKDPDLLMQAQEEKRVILTRDHALFKICRKKNFPALLISHDHFEDQLKQVFQELNIQPPLTITQRCLNCNKKLQEVNKTKIEDKIPAYIFNTEDKFHICPNCHKIFWPGTHWLRMKEKLEHIFKEKK